MHTVYLALGTNLGDKEHNIRRAVELIGSRIGAVLSCSSMYVTAPWGFRSDHDFVNAAVRVSTSLAPRDVLAVSQDIERTMGRTAKSVDGCYHDRIIDIDILLYDDLQVDEDDLKIPHPLMFERDFVMKPLAEVLDSEGRRLLNNIQ